MRDIPTLALLAASPDALRVRAEALRDALAGHAIASDVVRSTGSVGAGAFPEAVLDGAAVALHGDAERWARRLRDGHPAVVGRVHEGRLLIDLRAVLPRDLTALERAVVDASG